MKKYQERVIDAQLSWKLAGVGSVLVEGAKWCGKTTSCEQVAKSVLYLAETSTRAHNLKLAEINPSALLEGATPRLIDEWQDAPQLWDAVRYAVDHADAEGLFILTGSSILPKASRDKIVHSGTGRIVKLRMRPMSLWESGESSGEVSLGRLFASAGDFLSASARKMSLDEMAYSICRGGWPKAVLQSPEIALDRAREYLEAVVESDISRVDDVPRDPDRVRRLLRSYARLQGTQSNLSAIRKDMLANDIRGLNEDTISSYLNALRAIFVVEDMPAWCPSLRDKTSIRASDTRYFTDPSIAAAALGAGPGSLMKDLRTFGYLFEGLAIRDLRVYSGVCGGHVEHYHDKSGLECDAVVHNGKGEYALVEIKLGGETSIGEGVASLRKFDELIARHSAKTPAFRMVLTAVGDFAYRRKEDGVIVCPLSALRP